MNAYLSIFIIALFALSCQKAVKTNQAPVEQKQVTDEKVKEVPKAKPKVKYGITYPKGWTIEKGYKGTASMALSDLRKSTNTRATMNIAISEAGNIKTEKEVFELAMVEYKKSIANISDLTERALVLESGTKVYESIFSGTVSERKMRFRILHSVKGELAFIVTAVSVVETFEQDNKDFYEAAFQTFFLRIDSMGNDVKREFYSIVYPEGWEVSDDINWADTSAVSPSGNVVFLENMAVTYELVPSLDLKTYVQQSFVEIKKTTPSFKVVSEGKVKLKSGLDAYELVFDRDNNGLAVRTKMVYALKSGMGYIVLIAGTAENFDTYEALLDKSLESFEIHRK